MSYIYSTTNGTAQVFNKETVSVKQSPDIDLNLEGFVQAGVMVRRDVLDNEIVLGEDVKAGSELTIGADGKAYMSGTSKSSIGSVGVDGLKGKIAKAANFPYSVNLAGSEPIVAGGFVVVGAEGKAVNHKATAVNLATAVTHTAIHDINNNPLADATIPLFKLASSVDDPILRGATVTIHGINRTTLKYQVDVVTLNAVNSSTQVTNNLPAVKVLGIQVNYVGATLPTANLVLNNTVGTIVTIATPDKAIVYGSIACNTSSNALGHELEVACVTPVAAASLGGSRLLVMGTDAKDLPIVDLLSIATGQTTAKTSKSFKTITRVLIGDDGVATNTFNIKILANTEGQKIGVNPALTASPANSPFLIKRVSA